MTAPDPRRARELLEEALASHNGFQVTRLTESQIQAIDRIIGGTHLTFRYLLVTALLAKVAEPTVHMRSLQAGANLPGAYDARSLCHGVWVPFEREFLDRRLGGSNEPFLNKPARFPAIDKQNAVRAGSDRMLLSTMCDLLDTLNSATADQQREALLYAFTAVMRRGGRTTPRLNFAPIDFDARTVGQLMHQLLGQSCGGEVPVSVVGAILMNWFEGGETEIRVHPANQAGSSSNEVGDIDVYQDGSLVLAVEVKDKPFIATDVYHAAAKAIDAGCPRLLFVVGRQGTGNFAVDLHQLTENNAAAGFDLAFAAIDDLVNGHVALSNADERRSLIDNISQIMDDMRSRDETRQHFLACLTAAGFTVA